jgi:hypothetical protein
MVIKPVCSFLNKNNIMNYMSTKSLNRVLLVDCLWNDHNGYSQEEFSSKSKAIPAKRKPVKPK